MFEINKKEFGAFVAQLRRQKGYTQKQLAQKLFVSDKAVSKWETGSSIPDTPLLVPLAEELGVTVTELLMCRRMEQNNQMDAGQVETVVKTAIHYTEEKTIRAFSERKNQLWMLWYLLCLLICGAGFLLNYLWGYLNSMFSSGWITYAILGSVFGAYFVFLVRTKLPKFYDENRIHGVFDSIFRMNIPGVVFNNRNWPHIVQVGRIWSCATMALSPYIHFALCRIAVTNGITSGQQTILGLSGSLVLMASLLIPLVIVAKKYE